MSEELWSSVSKSVRALEKEVAMSEEALKIRSKVSRLGIQYGSLLDKLKHRHNLASKHLQRAPTRELTTAKSLSVTYMGEGAFRQPTSLLTGNKFFNVLRKDVWMYGRDAESALKSMIEPFSKAHVTTQNEWSDFEVNVMQRKVRELRLHSKMASWINRTKAVKEKIKRGNEDLAQSSSHRTRLAEIQNEVTSFMETVGQDDLYESPEDSVDCFWLSKRHLKKFDHDEIEDMWKNYAHPSFDHSPFTEEEDNLICAYGCVNPSKPVDVDWLRMLRLLQENTGRIRCLFDVFRRHQELVTRVMLPWSKRETNRLKVLLRENSWIAQKLHQNMEDSGVPRWLTDAFPNRDRSSVVKLVLRLMQKNISERYGKFSRWEELQFRALVKQFGPHRLDLIQKWFPNRDTTQLRYFYKQFEKKKRKAKTSEKWSEKEDNRLLDAIDRKGLQNWVGIARLFRSPKRDWWSVRERYYSLVRMKYPEPRIIRHLLQAEKGRKVHGVDVALKKSLLLSGNLITPKEMISETSEMTSLLGGRFFRPRPRSRDTLQVRFRFLSLAATYLRALPFLNEEILATQSDTRPYAERTELKHLAGILGQETRGPLAALQSDAEKDKQDAEDEDEQDYSEDGDSLQTYMRFVPPTWNTLQGLNLLLANVERLERSAVEGVAQGAADVPLAKSVSRLSLNDEQNAAIASFCSALPFSLADDEDLDDEFDVSAIGCPEPTLIANSEDIEVQLRNFSSSTPKHHFPDIRENELNSMFTHHFIQAFFWASVFKSK